MILTVTVIEDLSIGLIFLNRVQYNMLATVDSLDSFLMELMFFCFITQPVVDAFDPRLLVSPPSFHTLDFISIKVTARLINYNQYKFLAF